MGLLVALLLAAPATHRAAAAQAEALGHMADAAREYEAAWTQEHAPDLLYRLGLVRRKLKQYGRAREAFRAYLRDAPEGGLREEVERQLAKLDVLIEAQSEDFSDPPPKVRRPAPPPTPSRAPSPVPHATPPAANPPSAPPAPAATTAPAPVPPDAASPSAVTAPPAAASPPAASSAVDPPAVAPLTTAPPAVSAPAATAQPATSAAAVPPAALAPAPAPPAPPRSRVAPWLAAGAAVTAAAGGYLWWDSARLSRDLDARFAAGTLSAADRPAYSRVHTEATAARALLGATAVLAASAVVVWW